MSDDDSTAEDIASADPNGASSEGETPPPAPAFKDRRAGLVVFGIVQLLVALMLLGMAGLQVFMFFSADTLVPGSVASPRLYGFAAGFYALLAAGAVWIGIGSIRYRRWARALTLVIACMGLVVGLLGSVLVVSMFKSMSAQMESQLGGSAPGASVAIGCTLVGMGFFYILVPASFVLFYRSRNVKATCEHYDPKARWTDRYPLAFLAGGLLLLSMAGALFAPLMGSPMPFFGMVLTGASAWVYSLVLGLAALALTWGFFRFERWAWLGTLILMAFNGLNAYFSFRGEGLSGMYEAMQVPPEQFEIIENAGFLTTLPVLAAAALVVTLAFYLWLGRYFGRASTT